MELIRHWTWTTTSERRKLYCERLRNCGRMQIGLGFVSLILDVILVSGPNDDMTAPTNISMEITTIPYPKENTTAEAANPVTNPYPGVWAGVAICISGVHGVFTSRKPTILMYRRDLCISLLSSVCGGVGFAITILVTMSTIGSPGYRSPAVLGILFIGTAFSIMHSVFSCAGGCARKNEFSRNTRSVNGANQIVQPPSSQYTFSQRVEIPGEQEPIHSLSYPDNRPPAAANPVVQPSHMRTSYTDEWASPPAYDDLPPSYDSICA